MTSSGARRPLIGTSWKMNLTSTEAARWFAEGRPLLEPLTATRDLFVLPPFPSLFVARDALAGSRIGFGGQDLHPDDAGAHTGDVSGAMLADLGCRYAEMGHSERRRDHCETDELIGAKVRAALRWQLTPVLCVGEPTRGPVGPAWSAVERELVGSIAGLAPGDVDRVVVAYEPVWAIGEGATAADPEHVGRLHEAIARWLTDRGATHPRVLYGGSVDEASAPDLLALPAVAGLFVGRAALDPRRVAAIAATPTAGDRDPEPPIERSA
jgi:triosephosphate isomerase